MMKRKREMSLDEFDSWSSRVPLKDVSNHLLEAEVHVERSKFRETARWRDTTESVKMRSRRKVKGKRYLEKTNQHIILEDMKLKCCSAHCLKKLPLDVVCELRTDFWNLVVMEQNKKIRKHRTEISGERCILGGHLVCLDCWRIVHGISRSRYMEQKSAIAPPTDGRTGMVYGHQRNAEAVNFFDDLMKNQGEKLPDKPRIMLPTCLSQKNAYDEYVRTHEEPFCFRHFQRIWRERFPEMKASERSTFTECKECAMIRQLKSQKLTKAQLLTLEKQKKAHLLVARIAREKYYKHSKKAAENSRKYLSIIIDNMDQAKTNLPRFPSYHKGDANLTRVHHHVTGVLSHGHKKSFVFTWTDKFGTDSNITINCLLKVLEDVAEERSLPPTLYLQADNSAKDNKNFILMGFLASLVQRKIFRKVKLSFLMVGHTHEDVDQMFSRISVHLSGKAIPTLPVLQGLIAESYHPTPQVTHLDALWDYRALGMASDVQLTGHSNPHIFRFTEVDGTVQMGYKEWPFKSTDYKMLDVTSLASAFQNHPDPLSSVTDKGKKAFDAMEGDLRKWKDGGKLSPADIHWWNVHLQGERKMPFPTIRQASQFGPYLSDTEETEAPAALETLQQHVSAFSRQSNVRIAKRRKQ